MSTVAERPKPATQHVNLVVPVSLKLKMQRLAEENCRSLNQEYQIAARRYIELNARKA